MIKHMNFLVPAPTHYKLSLTTAKPKAKIDSYNSWNKAFRVLTEIVALKWLDQCLLMVQYAAEISGNIGKFTFAATYNYDIKFRLKKQMKLALKWNEVDNSLWTKCFFLGQAEIATIPVLHHQLPSREMTEQTTKPAMTSISPDAPDLHADSHTSVTNASNLVTTRESDINSSLQDHPHWHQLNKSTF